MIPRILLSLFLFSSYALGASRTNVLFLIVDDLNTHLGCYGNPTVQSPHIDRLAAKGVRFDQAYCQYALCNPSRVSLLSGKRPETSGVYDLATKARDIFPQAIMLPELFRENGYFCAGAGKVHHGENHKDDRSWDFYSDQPGKDAGETAAIHERYHTRNGTPKPCILESDGSQTRDGLNVRKIAAFIEDCAERNQPFFLAAGFHKPHLPWTAPKRFYDLYPADSIPVPAEPPMQNVPEVALQTELSGFAAPTSSTEAVRGYYACISFTDSNLGLLLETLDRRNLWANTLVVLVRDNGFHLGDHNGLWSKLTTFENGTRVPLLMAGAGLPEGKVVQHPVELVDIYPTLAELAGLAAPAGLEGKSLVPALRSQTVAPDARAYSMIYHYDPATRSDILGRSVRTREFRYTEWSNSRQDRELYLPGSSAGEFRNLAGQALLQQEQGAKYLSEHVFPKPGVANRPRALLPSGKSGKE